MSTKQQALIPHDGDLPHADMIPADASPLRLLEIALENKAAIDVIERLAALQEKAQARDAEMQFNEAMNRAQAEIGRIAPDKENVQTHSWYASPAALDRVLRPIYVKHGFSLSYDTGESKHPEMVRVLCYVSHGAGHTRSYQIEIPADGKGAKGGDVMTKTHATGSAMTYGRRYLLAAIFNLAIGTDDDGNGASGSQMEDLQKHLDWIGSASRSELKGFYTEAYSLAHKAGDQRSMDAIVAAKNKRFKELNG